MNERLAVLDISKKTYIQRTTILMKGDKAKSAALNDFPSHHRPFINKPDPEKRSSIVCRQVWHILTSASVQSD